MTTRTPRQPAALRRAAIPRRQTRHRLPQVKKTALSPPPKSKAEKVLEHIPCGMTIGMLVTGIGYRIHQLVKCCFAGDGKDDENKKAVRDNMPPARMPKRPTGPKKTVSFADELNDERAAGAPSQVSATPITAVAMVPSTPSAEVASVSGGRDGA